MILLKAIQNMTNPSWTRPELISGGSILTLSGQSVSAENAKQIASYYRCLNILTDDLAMIPLQQFISRKQGEIERVMPDGFRRNMAYAVEVQPNPYQVPFILRKTAWIQLVTSGDCYFWRPYGRNQIYMLNAEQTTMEIFTDGSLWYRTRMSDDKTELIPAVEVLHLMINSTNGMNGRGLLRYARETFGRRLAAGETQANMYDKGLFPSAVATVAGEANTEARQKIRESYWEAATGSGNSGGVVVLDNKISKFEFAQIKPIEAQFLEGIQATDEDICNFTGVPLYKLSKGKQSYESNEQQDLDYMKTTLDPYLVQMEQGAKIGWLTMQEQSYQYWKFNRDAFLRMNSKARAAYLKDKILSGQYTPNQALAIDDQPSYPGGENHYIPSNMAVILPDGSIRVLSKDATSDPNEDGGQTNEK